jgi:hydroxymethylpyrimidine pyrophosphatase-like HAD family hydrolase
MMRFFFRVLVGVPNASFCEMKSSSIRLFAIDVDGTLLDSTHRLRTDVKDSVCRLAASGLEIALATARGPAAVREIVGQFDFSPRLICFSGGWIGELDLPSLQPKDVRLDHRISCAAARSILRTAFSPESIRSFGTATFSKTNYLEVLTVGVNKAKALAVLTEALGFELSQVAAIGDAPNDLEMPEMSPVGTEWLNAHCNV